MQKIYYKLAKYAFRNLKANSTRDIELLEKLIGEAFCKIGIGSGGGVESSGEDGVFALLKQSKPPYCIFDIGANCGKYLDLIIKSLWGGGGNRKGDLMQCDSSNSNESKNALYSNPSQNPSQNPLNSTQIHCFEPSIHTFKFLQDFYSANLATRDDIPNDNIFLNNFGLGAENATKTLYYDSKGSGLASLTKRRLEHFNIDFKESEQVQITTLDDYCQTHGISRIHLLKMDIEGHELDILNGAKTMFERGAIDRATFEFGGCNIDTRTFFQDFWYFFKAQNMQLYRILPSGAIYKISAYRELYEQFTTTNFLAMME